MDVPSKTTDLRARHFDDPGATLSQIGETSLLEALIDEAQRTNFQPDRRIVIASGDDAAVIQPDPRELLVVTQDAVVEGVDYVRRWTRPYLVGRRSLTLSLSDIASMGAKAAWCVVTYCAHPDAYYHDLLAIQQGLCDLALESDCRVVGGDLSRIDGPTVVDVVAFGTVQPGELLRRDAGRVGDMLVVTGTLGRAAAGLRLLMAKESADADNEAAERWISSQLDPVARTEEGPAMSKLGVKCCGDLSDGLLIDAERTAQSSGCAAEIWLDRLPIDPGIRESFPDEWLALALSGGEDFELLAAVPNVTASKLIDSWNPGLAPLTLVGRLTEGTGVRLLDHKDGTDMPKPKLISRHFLMMASAKVSGLQ
jgi:thiamine-monophosphate kinase